jgi:hypothetical protein
MPLRSASSEAEYTERLISVFAAHAAADEPFARELSLFLEFGCDRISVAADSAIRPGEDILCAAETGLSADFLLLLLSTASTLPKWPRDRWEPMLFGQADTQIGVVLLGPCSFPELFRRRLRFFDATASERRLGVLRRVKRWVRGHPEGSFSTDLEFLYELADRPGILTASGAEAGRFAREAAADFDAVCRIPALGRTLAQVAGELGVQLGMSLDGPLEDNCRRIRDLLAVKRCLVIFDAPQLTFEPLIPAGGRTSFLLIADAAPAAPLPKSPAAARGLVSAGRFAEAYELLHELFDAGIDSESCARELTWICDHWGWYVEAGLLWSTYRLPATEQLSLF